MLLGGTDAAGLTGGVTIARSFSIRDTTSGKLTIGGQNTSGTNTWSGNFTLGSTPDTGKSVTLLAATGGLVQFTGNLLANGTDTTAGIIVGNGSNLGTVVLAGANTYNGATTVNAGKLLVSGSIGNSAVTVNNADTILASGTTGTIGSSVTVNNGAILAAGDVNSVGKATVGSGASSLASGSIFSWDLASNKDTDNGTRGIDYDALDTGGTLAVDSDAIFRVVLGGDVGAHSFW